MGTDARPWLWACPQVGRGAAAGEKQKQVEVIRPWGGALTCFVVIRK